MKTRWLLPLLALILGTLACNWSDFAPPAAPVIEPSPLPTFAIPSLTPTPTETPLPTPTSTPDAPIAWPKNLGVNCRYGPGKEWEVVSSLLVDTVTEIKGRTVDTSWWYIEDPLNLDSSCWVSYDVVETAGNLNIIPIVEPPVASVTDVSLDQVVVTFTSCGSENQVTFNGAVTTNGPTMVTYHWELSDAAQDTTPDATLEFTQAGDQGVSTNAFSADCGDYTATLRVTKPNGIFAEKEFEIQAP